jgi:ferredoxin-type protein NapG
MALDDDKPIARRAFFREGLLNLFKKVGDAAAPLQRAMDEFEAAAGKASAEKASQSSTSAQPPARATPLDQISSSPSRPTPYVPAAVPGRAAESTGPARPPPPGLRILRPPGAKQPDDDFVRTCSGCGNCMNACPVSAIQMDSNQADGAPFIIADQQPCVLCDGLHCMYNCPTGAITAVPIGLIDMGTARWFEGRCVRSQGTECTMCVDRCPIGPRAIELINGKIAVHGDGCTGCGVCEHDCPTTPKSIVVIPAALRDRA